MDFEVDAGVERRADEFFMGRIGSVLRNKKRRASFAMYVTGLVGDGERKSVEPIAARACADEEKADAVHQQLLHFVGVSAWDDRGVRREAASYALEVLTEREPVQIWAIDDTGFLKQGKHSVGVQRQYTGSAGKNANCQIGVSLTVCTLTEQLPIDFELYLPRCWTDDPARRAEARIPDEVVFKTKPQLAVTMLERAVEDGIPQGVVVVDSGYGDNGPFRAAVRKLGLCYAAEVHAPTTVCKVDGLGQARGQPSSVREVAAKLSGRSFRRVVWRDATKKALWARFARKRVIVAHDDGTDVAEREQIWLLMEQPADPSQPARYYLLSLPNNLSLQQLVHFVKQRWRTERMYEEVKGELGLDHFEGRGFRGWHHHVSAVLCCYAFIVAERVRRFPPSRGGTGAAVSVPRAA
jgi:SRSO17 transposase